MATTESITVANEIQYFRDAWEDIRIIPTAFDVAGGTDPSLVNYQPAGTGATIKLYEFAKNDAGYFTCQVPHAYKLGSDIHCHVHWTPGANGATENGKTVGWKVDWSWASINANFSAIQTVDLSDACDGTDHKHQMTPDIVISGSGKGISSQIIGKIYRSDTGTDDTWAGTLSGALPLFLEMDFHFITNTLGTNSSFVK